MIARDLEADLAICEAATSGRWQHFMVPFPESLSSYPYHHGISSTESTMVMALTGPWYDEQSKVDAQFIAAAREGWPYAIRRAMEAEDEIDKLRNELQIYQERDRSRGCWD